VNGERLRILLVQDDENERLAMERQIGQSGLICDLVAALTVEQARSFLQAGDVDVVLVEQQLPDGASLDVLQSAGRTPCIVITDSVSQSIAVRAAHAGVSDVLIKDVSGEYLQILPEAIQAAVARRRADEQSQIQRGIINSLNEIVLLLDEEGRVTFANPAVESLTGYAPADVLGDGWWELVYPDDLQRRQYQANMAERARSRAPLSPFEHTLRRKDGAAIWVAWTESCNPQGGLICVGNDITERKAAEEAVQRAHRSLEQRVDARTVELAGANARLLQELTERERVERALEQRSRQLEKLNRASQMLTSTLDIDQVLTVLLEELRLLLNISACSIWLTDAETGDLVCRQAAGAKSEQVIGWRLKSGQGLVGWAARHGKSLLISDTETEPRHFKGVDQDTGAAMRSIITIPLRINNDVNGVLQALDTRPGQFNRTDVALAESLCAAATIAIANALLYVETDKLRVFHENIVQYMEEGVILEDADGYFTFVNAAAARMFGYSPEELIGQHWTKTVAPERIEQVQRELDKRPLGISSRYETVALNRRGERFHYIVSAQPLFDGDRLESVLSVLTDITERTRMEEALRDSEARLAGIFDCAAVGISLMDSSGHYEQLNTRWIDMLGYTLSDLTDLTYLDITHPDDLERSQEMFDSLVRGDIDTYQIEKRYIRKNGATLWGDVAVSAIYDVYGQIEVIIVTVIDITNRKLAENELQRMQKLESLGLLAGGIAHDFNNLLTGILGNVTLARMESGSNTDTADILHEAERACIRASQLTQQLLTFSKGGAPIKRVRKVGDLVRDTVRFTLRGSNVRAEFTIPDDLWSADIDEGQISQVFNNITINADQAMPHGGALTVSAENVRIEPKTLPVSPGPYIKISIRDQGIGIPEHHLPSVFDPYFTTKQKGSGLGLATSYSIIRQHGGLITVESRVNVGSVFHIYLPASDVPVVEEHVKDKSTPAGHGRVLIMDDEETIRQVADRLLRYLGYEVSSAADGKEAIEMYRQAMDEGRPFDVVITDLTIPGGMGGKEAIERLREIDPHVKGIVSSGYSSDPIMANYQDFGFRAVVTKPYDLSELGRTVQETLNAD
jgi:PAS domain S-box-containing protein